MKWQRYWPGTLIVALIVALEWPSWTWETKASGAIKSTAWTIQKKLEAREKTRELWYHGFDSYMRYAFPLDELTPLTCTGRGPDWDHPENVAYNDVAGNFSLTLIDVLDTLVVLDDRLGFEKAVQNVIDWVQFDVNTKPQVFETTIRVIGGLLSGHMFANRTGQPFFLPWYRGELLQLAHDLGNRLLPAFSTPTGIPYARVNLRHGIPNGETVETCTAGAGSLILEFGALSRLTGDDRFEKVAYKAFFALWNRKSDIGLVGNTINTWSGAWTHPEVASIGAGIDSFYEYALKWYVLSGETEFLDVWDDAYASVMRYARANDGFWYRSVNIHTGDAAYSTVDSLSAFWPGLQVLAGDVQNAIKSHMMYWNLWRRHSGLPEVWDINYKQATSFQYPLRPELVESTWYLYRATRDPFYLDVGERILSDIIIRAKVDCGLTGIRDLRTNTRDDRMESFALSETLKYLFLLFDEENPLHRDDSNYVFTTEGHIISLDNKHIKPLSPARRKLRSVENHQCPIYRPHISVFDAWDRESGLVEGIRSRIDVDYSRLLVGLIALPVDQNSWSPNGWCEMPKADLFSYDYILSSGGQIAAEDLRPTGHKIIVVADGYVIQNVTGIRTHIVQRLDGKGYDIAKLGPHAVRAGQTVYINDSSLILRSDDQDGDGGGVRREMPLGTDIQLRFFLNIVDPLFQLDAMGPTNIVHTLVTGYVAMFAGDILAQTDEKPLRFGHVGGTRVVRDNNNPFGCLPHNYTFEDAVVLMHRGDCTFLEKLLHAKAGGAAGILVVNDEDFGINPIANPRELAAAGDLRDVVLIVLTLSAGKLVSEMVDLAEKQNMGQVMVALDPERWPISTSGEVRNLILEEKKKDKVTNKILYLNGHPLQNTRLLI